jgi:hypothetical protein
MKRITDGMDAKNFEGLNIKQIILQRLKAGSGLAGKGINGAFSG